MQGFTKLKQMKTLTSDYTKQANDFLEKTGVKMTVEFIKHDKRDIYNITLDGKNRSRSFTFGNSLQNSGKFIVLDNKYKATHGTNKVNDRKDTTLRNINNRDIVPNSKYSTPTAYDFLACLTKYEVGTFEDFCSNFGYDTDSKKAEIIYDAVCLEYSKVCAIFTDSEITELQEIS